MCLYAILTDKSLVSNKGKKHYYVYVFSLKAMQITFLIGERWQNWHFFCLRLYFMSVIIICTTFHLTRAQTGCTCMERAYDSNAFPSVNNWIENCKTVGFSSAPASVWSNKNMSCLNSTMAVYRQLSATSFMQLMLYAAVCGRHTHYFVVLQLRVKWMKCSNRGKHIIILIFQFPSSRTC